MRETPPHLSLTRRKTPSSRGKLNNFARRSARFNIEREVLSGLTWSSPVNDLVVPFRAINKLSKQNGPNGIRLEPLLVLPTTKEILDVTQAFRRLSAEAIGKPETLLGLTPVIIYLTNHGFCRMIDSWHYHPPFKKRLSTSPIL
jgi:hypothetical protein